MGQSRQGGRSAWLGSVDQRHVQLLTSAVAARLSHKVFKAVFEFVSVT